MSLTLDDSFSAVTNWISNFENKLSNLLNAAADIPDEELFKLGKKDPETYPFIVVVF